jgi:hypothetical protein
MPTNHPGDQRRDRLAEFRQMLEEAKQSAATTENADLRNNYQQLAKALEQLIREFEELK